MNPPNFTLSAIYHHFCSTHLFCEQNPDPPSSERSATTLPSDVASVTAPKMEGAPAAVRGFTTRVMEVTPRSFWDSVLASPCLQ